MRFACRVCLELGIDDPETWLDLIPERVFDLWWSYYQCEPFGRNWEQSASIAASVSNVASMIAASNGVKSDPASVLDFMPSESLPWMKRKKYGNNSVTDGKVQALVLPRMFGFR